MKDEMPSEMVMEKKKHLRKDLNELGVFVKDEGEDQYVRSIKQ